MHFHIEIGLAYLLSDILFGSETDCGEFIE